jgi:hypothetical protein
MKINLISHACIQVTNNNNLSLVTDPWVRSPVFFSSWFLCPEPLINESFFFTKTNYIYLTHWHFDHFDYKSMRNFNKNIKVFVPKFPCSIMVKELNNLGFFNICEMVNKKEYELDKNFSIISHQIEHHDDSVLIIKVDGKTIINLNDAKPFPSSWKWLIKNFYKPEFIFRSHSIAWSFPTKYTFHPEDYEAFEPEIYMKEFIQTIEFLKPKYAVPFASYICHLHKENATDNKYLITPYDLDKYIKLNYKGESQFIIMNPGGKYSDNNGFSNINNYNLEDEIIKLKNKYSDYLEKIYLKEENEIFNVNVLEKYFKNFIKATGFLKYTFRKVKWIIETDKKKFLIDFEKTFIGEVQSFDKKAITAIIKVHKSVLKNSLEKFIFSNIDIAKRWNIEITKGNVQKHLYLTALISIYEGGLLPLSKNLFKKRFIIGYLRRLPELIDYLKVFLKFRKGITEVRNYISGVSKNN